MCERPTASAWVSSPIHGPAVRWRLQPAWGTRVSPSGDVVCPFCSRKGERPCRRTRLVTSHAACSAALAGRKSLRCRPASSPPCAHRSAVPRPTRRSLVGDGSPPRTSPERTMPEAFDIALPSRQFNTPLNRLAVEEERAWALLYASVGRACTAEEVVRQLDADAQARQSHLALYLRARTTLREHKAVEARNQRIGAFVQSVLRSVVTLLVVGPFRLLRSVLSSGTDVVAGTLPRPEVVGRRVVSAPSRTSPSSQEPTSVSLRRRTDRCSRAGRQAKRTRKPN